LLIPAYDDAMHRLFFVSHRTGSPQIFAAERETGALVQVTDHADIAEWSVSPSRDGRYVYFTAAAGAWRVDVESLRGEELLNFGTAEMREQGMVGAAMGTTAVSYDDRWWAVPVTMGRVSRLVIIDTGSGQAQTILERDSIGHPEFHPDDSSMLQYAGPYHNRIWVINRDGTGHRLVYQRNAMRKQWVVHEAWLPGTRELTVVDWPRGMFAVNVYTGVTRPLCAFNAWHAISDRKGTLMVADTTYPDIGLRLFDTHGIGEPRTLCYPEAWNLGAHWHTDHCPYDDEDYKQGKWKVYAPQHSHPHPSFSPDGRYVVYTSDRTGHSQVYEVEVPQQ
jgi:oligogalacturonide lyase